MTCDTIQSIYNELYYRHFICESIYNQKSFYDTDMGECMFIFRLLRRLVLIICIILGAIYAYDAYQSYQGTNRVSKAHTTVEQTIEKNEDTLSRWERIYRMLTFKEKVEIALYQRVSKDTWVKSDVIPDNAKRALIAIEDKRYAR